MRSTTTCCNLATLALILVALLAGGCSFNRDWKRSASQGPAQGIVGRWEGSWLSERNGHHGKLRCLLTEENEGAYQARFHAKYFKILSFGYTVRLVAAPAENGVSFEGEADLGWLAGGVYRYKGHANATNFFSTYSSKHDHGTFKMGRPEVPH